MRLGPQEHTEGRKDMRKERNRPEYIASKISGKEGKRLSLIRKVPDYKPLRALFCKHHFTIQGESCSEQGLRRISGETHYVFCTDCGKMLEKHSYEYF